MVSEVMTMVTLGGMGSDNDQEPSQAQFLRPGKALCLDWVSVVRVNSVCEFAKLHTYETWLALELWPPYSKFSEMFWT